MLLNNGAGLSVTPNLDGVQRHFPVPGRRRASQQVGTPMSPNGAVGRQGSRRGGRPPQVDTTLGVVNQSIGAPGRGGPSPSPLLPTAPNTGRRMSTGVGGVHPYSAASGGYPHQRSGTEDYSGRNTPLNGYPYGSNVGIRPGMSPTMGRGIPQGLNTSTTNHQMMGGVAMGAVQEEARDKKGFWAMLCCR